MKLAHEERPLRGARQEPGVELGNVFRCEANVKRGSVLQYRDGIDFARKRSSKASELIPAWWPSFLHDLLDGLDQRPRFWPTAKTLGTPSLGWIAEQMPIQHEAERERYLEGFRRAGLD